MKIVIFQPMLMFYREPLCRLLQDMLTEEGHELRQIFGMPWEPELKHNKNLIVDNDYCFFEKSHWFFNNKAHFLEGALKHILWADIVITEQANRHVYNYVLILLSTLGLKPFAYWGHGLNKQGDPRSFSERLKRIIATKTDWWFAYTPGVAAYVKTLGFPEQRISILYNSIDTHVFRQKLEGITWDETADFKARHKIQPDAQIGLYCGSLYSNKKIEFMLESAIIIRQHNPLYVLLVGGTGKDKYIVQRYADQYDFIIYLGALHGKEKELAFKSSDAFICPGLVGLAILDAFTASLPFFTTFNVGHGPEIEYLIDYYNGRVCETNIQAYSEMIIQVLSSPEMLAELKENAAATSLKFSIENMANHFVTGIQTFISHEFGKTGF